VLHWDPDSAFAFQCSTVGRIASVKWFQKVTANNRREGFATTYHRRASLDANSKSLKRSPYLYVDNRETSKFNEFKEIKADSEG
jgi:hypothetical protein